MEDILELYCLPYDPEIPLVCMDEQPRQLVKETRIPLPPAPGRAQCIDYEYERNGTANVFLFVEPLGAWRIAEDGEPPGDAANLLTLVPGVSVAELAPPERTVPLLPWRHERRCLEL